MQGIQSTIDAILINNPLAVSTKLAALGLVEESSILSPDEIKAVLYDAASRLPDEESNELAVIALDVPIDLEGENAEQLLQFHVEHGNRIAMMTELETYFNTSPKTSLPGMPYLNVLGWIMGVLMIVLIIALIKKI